MLKTFKHIIFSFNDGIGSLQMEEGLNLAEKLEEKFFVKGSLREHDDQTRSKVIEYLSKKQSQGKFALNLPATMLCLQKLSVNRYYLITDTTVSAAKKHMYDQCLDNFFDGYYGFEHTLSTDLEDILKECIYNLPQGESFMVVTNNAKLKDFCKLNRIEVVSE